MKKKTSQIKVCAEFGDMNNACLIDECPTPNIDMLIDDIAGHGMFSFINGFSRDNQFQEEFVAH